VTIERHKSHPLDALDQACRRYPGGVEALAARMKKTESTLRKELTQGITSHRIGYDDELSTILTYLEAAKVEGWADTLHAFNYRHGHLCVPIPSVEDVDSDELVQLVCSMVREVGEVGGSLTTAKASASDGGRYVTTKEFKDFDVRVEQALSAIAALRERVREDHLSAVSMGLVK
jgi:hypothetical protein